MTAQTHPDYTQEAKKLKNTYQYIQTFIAKNKEPITSQAANNQTAVALSQIKLEELGKMKQAQQEPYFGRVDVLFEGEGQSEPLYVGKLAIPDQNVFSWADTIAADYYYGQDSEKSDGNLTLKRTFVLTRDQLESIVDEFIDRALDKKLEIEGADFTDQLLMQLLNQHKSGRLHDIVATLQQQQYRIIQSPLEQLLVVQGVPGSGKTQVALHRVSFLLYHHKQIVPNRVLILGPNPLFMQYIGKVLPSLGNRSLLQRTFDEWLIEQLGDQLNYESQDVSLEALLDQDLSHAERVMRYRNAQNKGSLKMAQLLDRYTDWLHTQVYEQVIVPQGDFVFRVNLPGLRQEPVSIPVEDMKSLLEETRRLPLNQRQDEIRRQLARQLRQTVQGRSSIDSNESLNKAFETILEDQLREYFTNWRAENVSVAYRRLLRNPEILRQVGAGIFSDWDLELLTQDAPTARIPFRFSDLAGLLYLKLLLDGPGKTGYDHVVVDEAQDLTPLHFKVLYAYSRNGSMTVLGDLAQSIYPHHGLDKWADLAEVVGGSQPTQENIRESYRSTQEITQAANQLLERAGLDHHLARPFARNGAQLKIQGTKTLGQLTPILVNAVKAEQKQGHNAIALIAKTAAACQELAHSLNDEGFQNFDVIDNRKTSYNGGVVVIPAYLTKGLEFDTAIITDASVENYPPDILHTRLLYVAMTRAAHTLHLYWTGQITPILDQRIDKINLRPFLSGATVPEPVTIAAFAAETEGVEADWVVERLASADRLQLLREGCIDRSVLQILTDHFKLQANGAGQETAAQPLVSELRYQIRFVISDLAASPEPEIRKALILAQLVQGLLNNQLRSAGLLLPENSDNPVADQVVLLTTLLSAITAQGLILNAGRWTTRKRVLAAVGDSSAQHVAQNQLDLLIKYGIVEVKDDPPGIRVPQERIQGLLELCLGYEPWDWDEDILFNLARLPQPIPLEAKPRLEVSHE